MSTGRAPNPTDAAAQRLTVVIFDPRTPKARVFRASGGLGLPVPELTTVLIDLGRTNRFREHALERLTWQLHPAQRIAVTANSPSNANMGTAMQAFDGANLPAEIVDNTEANRLRTLKRANRRKVDVFARRGGSELMDLIGHACSESAVVRLNIPDPQEYECDEIAARLHGVSTAYLIGSVLGCEVLAAWCSLHLPALDVRISPRRPAPHRLEACT